MPRSTDYDFDEGELSPASKPEREPVLKQLGARIRLIRRELHLSQQECAALCHIDRAHMSRLERGFPNASVLHLAKLARGLGIEIADLFKA